MPRVYLTDADKDIARLSDNLRLLECGRSSKKMAAILGVSARTYCSRRQRPDTLTYQEMYKLCRNSGVSLADFVGGRLKLKGEEK